MRSFLVSMVLGLFIGTVAWVTFFPHKEVWRTIKHFEEENGGANKLIHRRDLVGPEFDAIVKPNNDTLYSLTSLDLSKGPLVFSMPPTGERYWSMQFMALSTDVDGLVGRRTHGGAGQKFLLVNKNWQGSVTDDNLEIIRLPSKRYWMLARVLVDGEADLGNVYIVQDGMALTPFEPH